jgi:DNA repair protein RadC
MPKDDSYPAVSSPPRATAEHYYGHRQRLKERFLSGGEAALADYELLELLLFSAHPRGDVKPLAKTLLQHFGSFSAVLNASPEELQQVKGIGLTATVNLKTVQAATIRLLRQEAKQQPVIRNWQTVIDYCRVTLGYSTVERFHLLFLDHHNRILRDEEQNRGTINQTAIYPREVARRALELGAAAVIMVHNHPSGDATPSKADIEMTLKVAAALNACGMQLHDHLIVSASGHVSLKGKGHF